MDRKINIDWFSDDDGWYVYNNSTVPERFRNNSPYFSVYYYFKTYGEAWVFLIARFGKQFDKINSL